MTKPSCSTSRLPLNEHTETEGHASPQAAQQGTARSDGRRGNRRLLQRIRTSHGPVHDDREQPALPFETTVLGVPVTVERIDLTQRDEIVAVSPRARVRQTVPIIDLPLPSPRPSAA